MEVVYSQYRGPVQDGLVVVVEEGAADCYLDASDLGRGEEVVAGRSAARPCCAAHPCCAALAVEQAFVADSRSILAPACCPVLEVRGDY